MSTPHVPGRTTISTRAFQKVAAAVVADALGVPTSEARASVRDDRGAIAADVTTGAPAREGVLAAATAARTAAAERLAALTGARVTEVRVRLTHLVAERRRVP